MNGSSYTFPTYRAIVLGILAFILVLIALCALGEVTKSLGAALLYLPSRLGVVQMVSPQQVQSLDLNQTSESRVALPAAGRYAVYTKDYDLLVISDQLDLARAEPWMRVRPQGGDWLKLGYVRRGLMPYDTPFADGRPVLVFTAPQAGEYELLHTRRPAVIYLAPDYTTGQETKIWLVYLVEILILASPFAYLALRTASQRRARIREVVALKRIRGESFWQGPATPKR